jgi:hypothetical protein
MASPRRNPGDRAVPVGLGLSLGHRGGYAHGMRIVSGMLAVALFPIVVAAGCGSGSSLSGTAGTGGQGGGTAGHGGGTTGHGGGTAQSSGTGTGGGLPALACRSDKDCPHGAGQFYLCIPPGGSAGCPICQHLMNPCTSDTDCASKGPAYICTTAPCACMGSDKQCVLGCTADAQCSADSVCDATHRCAAKPCASTSDCPANFTCGTGKTCGRTSCTSDAQCAGHCVLGSCYDAYGVCTQPPA